MSGHPRSSVHCARRVVALVLTAIVGAACGGDGGATEPLPITPPPPPVAPPTTTTTLRELSVARGKSFGTALDAAFFGTSSAQYNALVAREFNVVVAGNVMKWEPLNRNGRFTYRWANPDLLVAFAVTNGMKVRGHTLAWHQQNPTWLTGGITSGLYNADSLRVILREHVDSVVGHYRGKVYAWDVVNEALSDNGALRTTAPWGSLGVTYIDAAFRAARTADPAAQLYYNDYNLEFPGAKQDAAFALIQGMQARGVPIDGIGFQAHLQINTDGSGVPSRQSLTNTFARFAALGLKVEITELDIRVRTPGATSAELAAQAQGYSDVVSACLATSACSTIVVWGVNDGESWVPSTFPGFGQALLFDDAFGKKSTYNAVRAALGG